MLLMHFKLLLLVYLFVPSVALTDTFITTGSDGSHFVVASGKVALISGIARTHYKNEVAPGQFETGEYEDGQLIMNGETNQVYVGSSRGLIALAGPLELVFTNGAMILHKTVDSSAFRTVYAKIDAEIN